MAKPKLPRTKLSKVLEAMDANDWPKAIRIAAKFGELGTQKVPITRAASMLLSEKFYSQLGLDRAQILADAICAMRERFEPMRRTKK